jgi:hypothetical protein
MGYLPQFQNDLFVSYRRVSNQAHDKWVETFCQALGVSLRELVGDVIIWRDEEQLQTGQQWRAKVADALDNAAIFLAIISRTYFDSDECQKELDWFLGRLKGSTAESRRKILPILKQPPRPEQELPHEIGEIHRHIFYSEGKSGHFHEFSPDRDDADRRLFWEALERVAQDIMLALEELKLGARKKTLGTVFVARVSPELQLERERLRSDLQQRGYIVVPEQEYLWNADNHQDRMLRDLESARLCVHLVGCTESIEPTAAARTRAQLELAHAVMKRKQGPAPIVWMQPVPEIHPSARDLFDYITCDLADQGVEYSQGGFEDFKTQVYDKLPRPAQSEAAPVRQIGLIVEEEEAGKLAAIRALLADGLGLNPIPIKFVGTSPKDVSRLARTLSACEQCLIYWDQHPEEWVVDVLAHEALAGHLGRERMCVYVVGAETPEKAGFRTPLARTIVASAGLDESGFRAFFGAGVVAQQ